MPSPTTSTEGALWLRLLVGIAAIILGLAYLAWYGSLFYANPELFQQEPGRSIVAILVLVVVPFAVGGGLIARAYPALRDRRGWR